MLTEEQIESLAKHQPPMYFMNDQTRQRSDYQVNWDNLYYLINNLGNVGGDRYPRIEETLNDLDDCLKKLSKSLDVLKEINAENRDASGKTDPQIAKSLAKLNEKYVCSYLRDRVIKIEIPDITLIYRGAIAQFSECWLELQLNAVCPENIKFCYTKGPRVEMSSQHPHASGWNICYGSGLPHAKALSDMKRYDLLIDRFVLPVLNGYSAANPYLSFSHYITERVDPRQTCPKCRRIALVSNAVIYQENDESERYFYHPKCFERAQRDNLLPPPAAVVEAPPETPAPVVENPVPAEADPTNNIPIGTSVAGRDGNGLTGITFTTNAPVTIANSGALWATFSNNIRAAQQRTAVRTDEVAAGTGESLEQQIAREDLELSDIPF